MFYCKQRYGFGKIRFVVKKPGRQPEIRIADKRLDDDGIPMSLFDAISPESDLRTIMPTALFPAARIRVLKEEPGFGPNVSMPAHPGKIAAGTLIFVGDAGTGFESLDSSQLALVADFLEENSLVPFPLCPADAQRLEDIEKYGRSAATRLVSFVFEKHPALVPSDAKDFLDRGISLGRIRGDGHGGVAAWMTVSQAVAAQQALSFVARSASDDIAADVWDIDDRKGKNLAFLRSLRGAALRLQAAVSKPAAQFARGLDGLRRAPSSLEVCLGPFEEEM